MSNEVLNAVTEMGESVKEFKEKSQVDLDSLKSNLQEGLDSKNSELEAIKGDLKEEITKREALELAISKSVRDGNGNEIKSGEGYKKAINSYLRRKGSNFTADDIEEELAVYRGKYKEMDELTFKTMFEGSNPDGGYLAPLDMANLIIGRVFEANPFRSLANVITTSTQGVKIPIDNDEADCVWVDELESRGETATPKISEVTIGVEEIYAEPQVTNQMLEDSAIDIASFISQKVGNKFSRKEGIAFISGNGVKKPRGILTYDPWTDPNIYEEGKIAQIESAISGEIGFDDLIDLQTQLLENYRTNAVWLMNRFTFSVLQKKTTVDGQYLLNIDTPSDGTAPRILGKPVMFMGEMPNVSAGNLAVAFGSFGEAYTIVDRRAISLLIDPYTTSGRTKYRFSTRVGGGVVNFQAIKLLKVKA